MASPETNYGSSVDEWPEELVAVEDAAIKDAELQKLQGNVDSSLTPRQEVIEIELSDGEAPRASKPRLMPKSLGVLRQKDLHGNFIGPSEIVTLRPPRRGKESEPPTHHILDPEAVTTWVYPAQMAQRDYQYSACQKALLHNVLVSLPTGLGKTFIAAVVMFNWYRWAPESKIVFVAPTKPLVAQQVEACYRICGIPPADTARLTGQQNVETRRLAWATRRVFFMTPQTFQNDLRNKVVDPRSIVCVVVDEAHRARGTYAYVELVKLIRQQNKSFRILSLSATPGGDVSTVQDVITNLCVEMIEARTEESIDIFQYVHSREIVPITVELSEEIVQLTIMLTSIIKAQLDKLKNVNDHHLRDVASLTQYAVVQARQNFMRSPAAQSMNIGLRMYYSNIFALLVTLAHALNLLQIHGIRPFYNSILGMKDEGAQSRAKLKKDVVNGAEFQKLLLESQRLVRNPQFVSHPKIDRTIGIILNHFTSYTLKGLDTRVIVFAQYRDSAEEIQRMLQSHTPMIKPTVFVGQAESKNSIGMNQKLQIETVGKFAKGDFNVLVATSIGEEGLDIGHVDLIVSFDASSSPIRMLQRFGRAGRKRKGHIYILMTKGREEMNYVRSQDAYRKMQEKIARGDEFEFQYDKSPRILPSNITPSCVKISIVVPDIPLSDKDLIPSLPKRPRNAPKQKKVFHMPDDAIQGFRRASELQHLSSPPESQQSLAASWITNGSELHQQLSEEEEEATFSNDEATNEAQYSQLSTGVPSIRTWLESTSKKQYNANIPMSRLTKKVLAFNGRNAELRSPLSHRQARKENVPFSFITPSKNKRRRPLPSDEEDSETGLPKSLQPMDYKSSSEELPQINQLVQSIDPDFGNNKRKRIGFIPSSSDDDET